MLRCKMRVSEVVQSRAADGSIEHERVSLCAVYGPEGTENGQWSKWTPSANFAITISNPEAFGKLSKGHEFFVDFTPANPPAASAPKDLAGAATSTDSETKEIPAAESQAAVAQTS